MSRARTSTLCVAALAALSIGVAGCGGGSSSTKGAEGSSTKGAGGYSSTATSTTSAQGPSGPAVVTTKPNATFGPILATSPGTLTLYMFVADHAGKSACYGTCASVWPPLLTKGAPKAAGGARQGELGTIKRTDGTTQVTYAGHPLYLYTPDKTPSDVTGQGITSFGALWYVVSPSGSVVTKP